MSETFIPIGDDVLCDLCNEDYTHKVDSGGFMFSSYAYCPKCAEEHLKSIRESGEEHFISERCPANMSFADWIRELRGPDAGIRIIG
jgi:hypothetical protein